MRANAILFWILAAFFAFSAILYSVWTSIDGNDPGVEWAGTVALSLTTVLSAFIAFYLGQIGRASCRERV